MDLHLETIIKILIGVIIPLVVIYFNNRNQRKLFEKERKDKFRLAALEKRLEAHQQAYAIWYDYCEMLKDLNAENFVEKLKPLRIFLINNNIYLEQKTRIGFQNLLRNLEEYITLKTTHLNVFHGSPNFTDIGNRINFVFNEIQGLGEIIQKEVFLEPIDISSKLNKRKGV